METTRGSRIDRLLQAVVELPAHQRDRYLEEACQDDPDLLKEVRSILVRYDKEDDGTCAFYEHIAFFEPTEIAELETGECVERYEILSKLGKGGMAVVYLAEDSTLKRKVALKVLKPVPEAAGGSRSAFVEARTASLLNHINIVTVFDAGEARGLHFIASEYVRGSTLRARLANGPLPLREALDIAIQITSALGAAHAAGIIHRDIKPENVIVRVDGVVKVLDFGIAKVRPPLATAEQALLVSGETKLHSGQLVFGSLPYMSPEQLRGKTIDSRSDVFAFGAVLYELITGQPAFAGDSQMSTLLAVSDPQPAKLRKKHIPRHLWSVIESCLQKDAGKRPQTIAEVEATLRRFRDHVDEVPSNRRRAAIAAGVSLVLASALIWWLNSNASRGYSQQQLTHDNVYKEPVIARVAGYIYFDRIENWRRSTARVSEDGRLQNEVIFPGAAAADHFEIEDGFPEKRELLVRRWTWAMMSAWPFEILHTDSGSLTNIPRVRGYSGAWSPDGQQIAYFAPTETSDSSKSISWALCVADRAGHLTRFWPIQDLPRPALRRIVWKDRRTLWFLQRDRLYEATLDSKTPRPVFESAEHVQGMGSWSADHSRYFFSDIWSQDLWELRPMIVEGHPWLSRITAGPAQFGPPVLGGDNRSLFAFGVLRRGRLIRYDRSAKAWQPFLPNVSGDGLGYSRDGKKLVYLSYPECELWAGNADGSGRRQLTHAPLRSFLPHFSPDGKNVVFMARKPGASWSVYLGSAETGKTERLFPGASPSWSPDGSKIIYSSSPWDADSEVRRLTVYDLRSKTTSSMAGSDNLIAPLWSPDGRFLAAQRYLGFGMNELVIFDPVAHSVRSLRVSGAFPEWSNDSEWLYYLTKTTLHPAIVLRVSVLDGHVEEVATGPGRMVGNSPFPSQDFIWGGLTPDQSPLMLEDMGNREIYKIVPNP